MLTLATAVHAEKLDPRLATMRNVYVMAADDLGDDRPVAACLAEHLTKQTPLIVVDKEKAEAILRVSSHLPSATARYALGALGGSPSAHLYVELPDGTKLWDDGSKARRGNTGTQVLTKGQGETGSIECQLADGLLDTLRNAMRKARNK